MLEKNYNPSSFEKDLYNNWLEKKYFSSFPNPNKKKFSISMPPLNVTGKAHMGHALNNTIQDTLIRLKRMKGYETLWVPGTDHAALATEEVMVRALAKEGKTKESIGREAFLQFGNEWFEKYSHTICDQLKSIGVSCDWDRQAFTMDDNLNEAVRYVFVKYFKEGLIYKGKRVVNYCPCCKTSISDNENVYVDQNTFLWHIRYPFADGSGEIIVATTRPETMFGDTAVAVNPNDPRYSDKIGKDLILPLTGRTIKLIGDDYCEMDFGTGAVKITPAHDPNDYEVCLRHNLDIITCIDDSGNLNEIAGKFKGLDRVTARKEIEKELKEQGFLVKVEKYSNKVGTCDRCGTMTEPKISTQWFVKMSELAKPAIDAVKSGEIKFVPKKYEKTYLNWLNNIKDWCISRQIWLGHRIPVFYCDECGEVICENTDPTVCPKCGCTHLTQDSDVLDTWFSSALWPFSTLGYPKETEEMKYYFPTDVLVTGYDIITFWVSKMVFSSLHFTGKIPFKDVLINGIVRDAKGVKMSKHLGNGIDPMDLIDTYGVDALRWSLIYGMSMGTDIKYSTDKTKDAKIFINKIWNAGQYVLSKVSGEEILPIDKVELSLADKWIISELNTLIKETNKKYDKYELGNVANDLYDFFWGKFCDWYIEMSKVSDDKSATASVLNYVFTTLLKLLHPIIPFVTEKIYLELPHHDETIMLSEYPKYNKKYEFESEHTKMELVLDIIRQIRGVRAEMKVADNVKTNLLVIPLSDKEIVESALRVIEKLSNSKDIKLISSESEIKEECTSLVNTLIKAFIPSSSLVDVEKEKIRLTQELEKAESEIKRAEGKLNNQGFVAKAPAHLVEEEKAKIEKYTNIKQNLLIALDKLK